MQIISLDHFHSPGLDGVAHGVTDTQVSTVLASTECLPLLRKVINLNATQIKTIIYFDSYTEPDLSGFSDAIEILPLSQVEKLGLSLASQGKKLVKPVPDAEALAFVMYTSGTTGTPKAALITHRQFLASIRALYILIEDILDTAPDQCYIAFLPMAHILELTIEIFFVVGRLTGSNGFFPKSFMFFPFHSGGVKIGYASPFTLFDSAPGLVQGEKSDIQLLRPTVITTVPLVLDRILKEINDKLRKSSPIALPVFKYLMNYKSCWTQRGFQCDLIRSLICSKIRQRLGGELK